MRERIFAGVLLAAAGLFAFGLALISVPAALMAGAVLLAGWAWLVLSAPSHPAPAGSEGVE